MFSYSESQVKAIAVKLIGTQVVVRPVGNHELKRHLVYHLTNNKNISRVLKLYYKKNRWNREVGALKLFANSSVKCPKLIDCGILENDTDWLMMEYVDGNNFDVIKDCIPINQQIKLIRQMGEELGKIHSLKTFDYFGNLDENGCVINPNSEYAVKFMRSREKILEELVDRHYSETNLLHAAGEYLKQNFHLVEDIKQYHLCVNDCGQRNIIVDQKNDLWELAAIIDFEQCTVGDKERDLANLYYDLLSERVEYGEAFLDGYRKYSEISDSFFDKLEFYVLDSCLSSCTWAREQAPNYYRKMIQIISKLIQM